MVIQGVTETQSEVKIIKVEQSTYNYKFITVVVVSRIFELPTPATFVIICQSNFYLPLHSLPLLSAILRSTFSLELVRMQFNTRFGYRCSFIFRHAYSFKSFTLFVL